ncbi:uncharacterized protein LOC119453840 [Dermacentor silvarum]|uniref:uncharacterized protein LOC119453840 n=1 Tax=Dermacentor silvarum TaxID=543639 RepID=UPI00189AA4AD|nr:uncharacterized protein LOC119453840 [Dermacentor silvarum]
MGPKLILTEEEKEARKKRRAEQARIRYAAKCGAAREQMLQAIREARWRKKSALDDSQRRAMLQARYEARKKKRAMLDEEGREAMLEAHHNKRATLDEKQREVMLEAKRQTRCHRKSAEQCNHRRESERMAAMTGEQHDDHNRKKREAEQRRVASMTDEQRDEHYKQKREAEQRRVAAMTEQQRDEHYKQKREAVQQRVAALRLQCVSFAAQQTRSPCADAVPRTPQCVVPGCSSRSAPSSILYPLPAKPSQRQAWIDFVRGCPCGGARDWNPPINEISLVCSLHFTARCFRFQRLCDFSVGYSKRLIAGVVPTLYPIEERCSLVPNKNSTAKSAALLGSSDDEDVERRTRDSSASSQSVAGQARGHHASDQDGVRKFGRQAAFELIFPKDVSTQCSMEVASKMASCVVRTASKSVQCNG